MQRHVVLGAEQTAVESAALSAVSVGAGVRAGFVTSRNNFGIEYAHGISDQTALDRVNRLSVSLSKQF